MTRRPIDFLFILFAQASAKAVLTRGKTCRSYWSAQEGAAELAGEHFPHRNHGLRPVGTARTAGMLVVRHESRPHDR
jgi:hypothetical protein